MRGTIPALVVIGGRDVQIDIDADGVPLQAAASSMVSFAIPESANHVLKEEDRDAQARAAAPSTGYNEPGTRLDPDALATVLDWLTAPTAR